MAAPVPATPILPQHCNIYCDESRQVSERFMVLAGAIISVADLAEIKQKVAVFRQATHMTKEMKWVKVSKGKLQEYKQFIDVFASMIPVNNIAFHSVIIDTHQIDHRKFNHGDRELGFYKFFYQLLLHGFGGRYCRPGTNDRFHVLMDYRNSPYSLETLRTILNRGIRKKYKSQGDPFRTIQPIDSRCSDIMQFVDVVAGAIGFQKNGFYNSPTSSPPKRAIVEHLLTSQKLSNLTNDTPYSRKGFTIWNFRLSK